MWLWSAALAAPVDEIASPRPTGWVADAADALPPEVEAQLNAQIESLHRDLDVEIAVAAVPTVGTGSPAELASSLLTAWGIGDAQADNGVLVLVEVDRRHLEVQTGDGLKPLLSQGWLADLEPRSLAAGSLPDAVEAEVLAIDQRLRERPDEARLGAALGPRDDRAVRWARIQEVVAQQAVDTLEITGVLGIFVMLGLAAGIGGIGYVRRRERTCPTCGVFMPMLPEDEDDRYLTPGQVTEEKIGSVDYEVHQCPKCGRTKTFEVHQFQTSYNPCPKCNNRTREIVVTPGSQPGVERVDERCMHCDYQATWERYGDE